MFSLCPTLLLFLIGWNCFINHTFKLETALPEWRICGQAAHQWARGGDALCLNKLFLRQQCSSGRRRGLAAPLQMVLGEDAVWSDNTLSGYRSWWGICIYCMWRRFSLCRVLMLLLNCRFTKLTLSFWRNISCLFLSSSTQSNSRCGWACVVFPRKSVR